MKCKFKKIIVEGPDNCGKSTQISNIVEYFNNTPFIKANFSNIKSLKTTEEVQQYSKKLYSYMFEIDVPIVCDRGHFGEYVYGKIYRGYEGDYIFDLEQMYNLNENEETILILFIDSAENLISRDDGLSFSTNIDIKKLEIKRFKEAFNKSCIKHKALINVNKMTIKQIFDIIKALLEE